MTSRSSAAEIEAELKRQTDELATAIAARDRARGPEKLALSQKIAEIEHEVERGVALLQKARNAA